MSEGAPVWSQYPERPQPSGLVTSAWKGRRWKPDGTDVFCGDRRNQPETLFETEHFFVVPDLFPVTPGHILIIPKDHRPCFATTPARWDAEIDRVVSHVRAFVRDTYGLEALVWENGGSAAGQSVHHAHLHIIPMPASVTQLPPPIQAVQIPKGLAAVRVWWRSQKGGRPYHIMELGNDRRLLPAGGQDMREANQFKGIVLGMQTSPDGTRWVRDRNPAAVAHTILMYRRWELVHPLRGRRGPASPGRDVAA